MFLTGISTRTLSMISKKLVGRKISAGEVSNVNNELIEAAEKWRTRDLSEESIKYMFIDSGLQAGEKESASSWREFFKDLKDRCVPQLPGHNLGHYG